MQLEEKRGESRGENKEEIKRKDRSERWRDTVGEESRVDGEREREAIDGDILLEEKRG